MQTSNPHFWDQLYSNAPYMFGEEPNAYFAQKLATIPKGKLLLPGDGEGRNAVYSALQGWEVHAFDLSEIGKQKADQLASKNGVEINFQVTDVRELEFPAESFDAMGLVFAHFNPEVRRKYHKQLLSYLKPGGYIILEGFARPEGSLIDIRFNLEELKEDFNGLEFIEFEKTITHLNEGMVIQGENKVVRVFARKPLDR